MLGCFTLWRFINHMVNDKITKWGLKIHPLSMESSISLIEESIKKGQLLQHIVVNAAKVVYAQKDISLRRAINNSDLVNIDGMAVVWALRLLGYRVQSRVTGIDLFCQLLKLSSVKGYRVYLLGAEDWVIKKLSRDLSRQYKNLNLVGFRNGYFSLDEVEDIINEIKSKKPDMLFLGVPSPQKELFMDKYKKELGIPFIMGVGGSFDIFAGKTRRAPDWVQGIGMEWFYRIMQEPRRMWKRYAYTNTMFIYMTIRELIGL